MKYIMPILLGVLSGCSIRATALVETGEASYSGTTTISRQQDPNPTKQFSTLEGIIRGEEAYQTLDNNPKSVPSPSATIAPKLPKAPLFTEEELNSLIPQNN